MIDFWTSIIYQYILFYLIFIGVKFVTFYLKTIQTKLEHFDQNSDFC